MTEFHNSNRHTHLVFYLKIGKMFLPFFAFVYGKRWSVCSKIVLTTAFSHLMTSNVPCVRNQNLLFPTQSKQSRSRGFFSSFFDRLSLCQSEEEGEDARARILSLSLSLLTNYRAGWGFRFSSLLSNSLLLMIPPTRRRRRRRRRRHA